MIGVFLSHSHKDNEFTKRLATDLQNSGIRVWHDLAEIRVGDSLIAKLSSAIHDMQYLVVTLSKASVTSEWVKKEVTIALESEIRGKRVKVLPLLIEDCEVPPFLRDKLYADFRERRNYRKVFKDLINRIKLDERYGTKSLLENCTLDWKNHGILIDWERLKILSDYNLPLTKLELEVIVESIFGIIEKHHFAFEYAMERDGSSDPDAEKSIEFMHQLRGVMAKFDKGNQSTVSSKVLDKFSKQFRTDDYSKKAIKYVLFRR